tara:strand:+ start:1073 stop:1258 length:186 start_codon:yes stop_codon:yes gene_type:complete
MSVFIYDVTDHNSYDHEYVLVFSESEWDAEKQVLEDHSSCTLVSKHVPEWGVQYLGSGILS